MVGSGWRQRRGSGRRTALIGCYDDRGEDSVARLDDESARRDGAPWRQPWGRRGRTRTDRAWRPSLTGGFCLLSQETGWSQVLLRGPFLRPQIEDETLPESTWCSPIGSSWISFAGSVCLPIAERLYCHTRGCLSCHFSTHLKSLARGRHTHAPWRRRRMRRGLGCPCSWF